MADFARELRLLLSKLKFASGLVPRVDRDRIGTFRYLPTGKKAVCLISADFEMAWAFRYLQDNHGARDPLRMAAQTRKNIPLILDYCDESGIPITWATVGHLFLESCQPEGGIKHPEIPRPPHYANPYWAYNKGDWFDADPASDVDTDPAWYAPDLIDAILSRKVKHEIGCHTFSHIDASDANCPAPVFASELKRCIELATDHGIKLRSFVHPGHQLGHLATLASNGFTSYRSDRLNTLGPPVLHSSGLWEYRNTCELTWREGWTADYQLRRLKTIIDRAIKNHCLCVLWFHPSMDDRFIDSVFPGLLAYLRRRGDEIASLTHAAYADFLLKSNRSLTHKDT